jgi:hypothetical protein
MNSTAHFENARLVPMVCRIRADRARLHGMSNVGISSRQSIATITPRSMQDNLLDTGDFYGFGPTRLIGGAR